MAICSSICACLAALLASALLGWPLLSLQQPGARCGRAGHRRCPAVSAGRPHRKPKSPACGVVSERLAGLRGTPSCARQLCQAESRDSPSPSPTCSRSSAGSRWASPTASFGSADLAERLRPGAQPAACAEPPRYARARLPGGRRHSVKAVRKREQQRLRHSRAKHLIWGPCTHLGAWGTPQAAASCAPAGGGDGPPQHGHLRSQRPPAQSSASKVGRPWQLHLLPTCQQEPQATHLLSAVCSLRPRSASHVSCVCRRRTTCPSS